MVGSGRDSGFYRRREERNDRKGRSKDDEGGGGDSWRIGWGKMERYYRAIIDSSSQTSFQLRRYKTRS